MAVPLFLGSQEGLKSEKESVLSLLCFIIPISLPLPQCCESFNGFLKKASTVSTMNLGQNSYSKKYIYRILFGCIYIPLAYT